jgi:hypothetical protein
MVMIIIPMELVTSGAELPFLLVLPYRMRSALDGPTETVLLVSVNVNSFYALENTYRAALVNQQMIICMCAIMRITPE